MKFGIITALAAESQSILDALEHVTHEQHGNKTFYSGTIASIHIVLVNCGLGKVAAAATTASLITHYAIDEIIVTGVAAGIAPHVKIGDVVIAKKLYYHDIDASPLYAKFEIPGIDLITLYADSLLVATATEITEYCLASIQELVCPQALAQFDINTTPQCLVGTVATGDQFINSTTTVDQIITAHPETLALEMEGAAVAQVCYDHKIPFVIIRIISNLADKNAEINFNQFIQLLATQYTYQIVTHLLIHSASRQIRPRYSYRSHQNT